VVIDKATILDLLFRFWQWITADPSAFFTFILAAVAIIQIAFLIRADKTARLAANAAKKAADATVALEIPHLFISRREMIEMPGQPFVLKYGIENAGKTPASLIDYSVELRGFRELPKQPKYLNAQKSNRVLYHREEMWPMTCFLSENDFQTIKDTINPDSVNFGKGPKLYFFGYFKFTDVFERCRITGFCNQIDPVNGFVHPFGGTAYNYTQETKRD
jgi:hypothetical protein